MFQYAIARHLSIKNKTKLYMDISYYNNCKIRNYELSKYNINCSCLLNLFHINISIYFWKILSIITLNKIKLIRQNGRKYNSHLLKRNESVVLNGFWQCEKYFKEIRGVILSDFKLKKPLGKKNIDFLEKIQNSNSVCLHIRRGDYISNKSVSKTHGPCSLNYYYNSVKYLKKKDSKMTFFVFSDDISWVRENLKLNENTIFVDINDNPYYDLELMRNCKHFITANSTFSWWAAWLSKNTDKIVIAPKKWFVNGNEGDIVPENWVRMKG